MKIATKISVSFLILSIIVTTIAASTAYLIAKRHLRNEIGLRLSSITEARAHHVETYLMMLKTSIAQLSKSVVLENFLKINKDNPKLYKEAFDTAMVRLSRTKEVNPSVDEFLVLDRSGIVIASNRYESIGTDKSTDAFFIHGQKTPYIKDPYYSETLKKPLMAVSTPMFNSKTGEFLGVLAARVELKDLNKITTDRTGLGKTGEIYIVNKDGYMITPSRFLGNTFLRQRIGGKNFENCLLQHKEKKEIKVKERITVYPDYRGSVALGTHAYIPEMEWCLLAEIDEREALLPLIKIGILFLIVLFAAPFVTWLGGIFLSTIITKPIHRLHKGAEIIGAGNLDYKVATGAKDEIGQLARAFDKMTYDLKHTTTSIENLNREIFERKKAEEVIIDSARKIRAIIDQTFQFIALLDFNGNVIEINRAALSFIGFKESDILHKPFWETPWWTHSAEEQKRLRNAIDKVSREEFVRFETTHLAKDGGLHYIDFSLKPGKDEKGTIVFMVAEGRDITERKNAENALKKIQKQEEEINALQQSLLVPNVLENKLKIITDGIVRIFDADFCRIWLIRPGDLCDKGCVHAAVKEGPHVCRFRDKCLHLMTSSGRYTHIDGKSHRRVPFDCYKIGRVASGKDHKFLTNDVPNDPRVHDHEWARKLGLVSFVGYQLRVPSGETIGVLALFAKHPILTAEDSLLDSISSSTAFTIQQSIFETKLAETAEEWEATFNSIPDLISIYDKNYRAVKVNKAFADFFKTTPEKLVGKICYEVVHGTHEPYPGCPHKKTLETKLPQTIETFEPHLGIYIEASTSPIFDDKKEVIGTVHIIRNVTERVRMTKAIEEANEKLKELDKRKSYFVANVSHEFKNPLATIKASLGIMLDGIVGAISEKQKELLGRARSNIERLIRLVTDLLDLSKIEAGRMELARQEIDIRALVNDILKTYEIDIAEKRMILTTNIQKDIGFIWGDMDKITEVIVNLLSNAIKYTPSGGGIAINLSGDDDRIRFEISDTGPGIAQEDIEKVFDKFERVTAEKQEGTGLGLPIAKEIIELHKGKMSLESSAGKGSKFIFVLPRDLRRSPRVA
ncbi:MAG: ATP-binding protein [Candidatus Omnitrophota bacterium]